MGVRELSCSCVTCFCQRILTLPFNFATPVARAGARRLPRARPWPDARAGFDEVRPRPLRGPRTSYFDVTSTWGYIQGPNRLEPSSART